MDELQESVEQYVSTTVLEKLEKGPCIHTHKAEDHERTKSVMMDCLDSAFKDYKRRLEPQQGSIRDLREEKEDVHGSLDAPGYQEVAPAKRATTRGRTLSSSVADIPTPISEYTDASTMPRCRILEENSFIPVSPEHLNVTEMYPLPTPWLLDSSTFMEPQPIQGRLVPPENSHIQQFESNALSLVPISWGHEPYSISEESEDCGWMNTCASISQI